MKDCGSSLKNPKLEYVRQIKASELLESQKNKAFALTVYVQVWLCCSVKDNDSTVLKCPLHAGTTANNAAKLRSEQLALSGAHNLSMTASLVNK